MKLTTKEKYELYYCIDCKLSMIETGENLLRAEDARKMGHSEYIRSLSIDQMKKIIMLEELKMRMISDTED
jgi:ribulose bisphosphate carboxylase small subunit